MRIHGFPIPNLRNRARKVLRLSPRITAPLLFPLTFQWVPSSTTKAFSANLIKREFLLDRRTVHSSTQRIFQGIRVKIRHDERIGEQRRATSLIDRGSGLLGRHRAPRSTSGVAAQKGEIPYAHKIGRPSHARHDQAGPGCLQFLPLATSEAQRHEAQRHEAGQSQSLALATPRQTREAA